jgi:hypothetical protein
VIVQVRGCGNHAKLHLIDLEYTGDRFPKGKYQAKCGCWLDGPEVVTASAGWMTERECHKCGGASVHGEALDNVQKVDAANGDALRVRYAEQAKAGMAAIQRNNEALAILVSDLTATGYATQVKEYPGGNEALVYTLAGLFCIRKERVV